MEGRDGHKRWFTSLAPASPYAFCAVKGYRRVTRDLTPTPRIAGHPSLLPQVSDPTLDADAADAGEDYASMPIMATKAQQMKETDQLLRQVRCALAGAMLEPLEG